MHCLILLLTSTSMLNGRHEGNIIEKTREVNKVSEISECRQYPILSIFYRGCNYPKLIGILLKQPLIWAFHIMD